MSSSAISLRIRRIRNRFGIAAPKVVVRSQLPWYWLVLLLLLSILFFVLLGWMLLQQNQVGEVGRELQEIRARFSAQQDELDMLRATAGTGQNAMSIERATQRNLLSRIRDLEQENAALKEDMLLFERLVPVVGDEDALRLEGFKVLKEEGGRYRYRLLVAYQPSRQRPEFSGRLQLVIDYRIAGRVEQLLLPGKAEIASDYLLSLRHFLRREGGFQLPDGAQLKGVEARVFQGAKLLGRQSAQL
jgi:hypothetical protein